MDAPTWTCFCFFSHHDSLSCASPPLLFLFPTPCSHIEPSVPQGSVSSCKCSALSAIGLTPSPTPVPPQSPTPIETTVTITTTVVNSISGRRRSEEKPHRSTDLSQHQQQPRRDSPSARRPLPAIEIHPLWCLYQDESFSVPADLQAQILRSLDYLEYLETCLLPEKEAKALKRRRRLLSWIAIKNFVNHHILGNSGNRNSNKILALHSNHSAPLIDRALLSPSPSPSLPILRASPSTDSRLSSRTSIATRSARRQQVCLDARGGGVSVMSSTMAQGDKK